MFVKYIVKTLARQDDSRDVYLVYWVKYLYEF